MIRVLADSSHDAALITEAVGGAAQVVNGSGRFTGGDAQVECVILGCRTPVPPGRIALVREIGRVMPWTPVILVTEPAPDIARWLGESAVSDIVWFDDVQTELRPRVDAQCRTAVLFAFAEEIEGAKLPPALRKALAHSFRAAADRPVRNVKDLADLLRRSPVTLAHAFRIRVPGSATLGGLLAALVILRAHQLRSSGLSWKIVSERLGFTRPTLHLKSKKWPGLKLRKLAETPRQRLLAKFASDHMQPLLDGDSPPQPDAAQRTAERTVSPADPIQPP